MRSRTHRHAEHEILKATRPFLETPRLKAGAIPDRKVYDMAEMQELCSMLHFSSRLIPILLSLTV